MVRDALDVVYKAFVLTLLLGIVTMDVEHWPIWRKDWTPAYFGELERWYVKKYNDPILAGYATPNGWMSAMYFCEQLHLPFLLYFLFAKNGIKKELGAIVVGTQITVVVLCCLFEVWAFDSALVSKEQKVMMGWFYGPFCAIPAIMVADMVIRVSKRVEAVEKAKAA